MKEYTYDEIKKIAANMSRFGGGFIQSLGDCISRADKENLKKLQTAFSEYFEQYLNF